MAHNPTVIFRKLLAQSGLSLERLQSFCQVAESGGITKAAGGDSTRQSLYSRQIKELEEFFGAELVRRSGRGVALTAAGKTLHRIVRECFAALADFKMECERQPVELSIGAGETLIQWLILPRLSAIRSRLTGVNVKLLNLSSREIAERLGDGRVDLGLVRSDAITHPLKLVRLGVMRFAAFVPRSLAQQRVDGKILRTVLNGLPLATLEGEGRFRQELYSVFQKQKIRLNIQLECPSFPVVARAVNSGDYAGILPRLAASELKEISELRPPLFGRFDREISLAWNPRLQRIRQSVARAVEFLQTELRF